MQGFGLPSQRPEARTKGGVDPLDVGYVRGTNVVHLAAALRLPQQGPDLASRTLNQATFDAHPPLLSVLLDHLRDAAVLLYRVIPGSQLRPPGLAASDGRAKYCAV